jgi:hypothetical protein
MERSCCRVTQELQNKSWSDLRNEFTHQATLTSQLREHLYNQSLTPETAERLERIFSYREEQLATLFALKNQAAENLLAIPRAGAMARSLGKAQVRGALLDSLTA